MRELGRRSEAAAPVFRMARSDDGSASAGGVLSVPVPWGARPTILVARTGQRDIVTAACPIALELGLAPGMAAAHARALVTDLDVLDAAPAADAAWLGRLRSEKRRGGQECVSTCSARWVPFLYKKKPNTSSTRI